MESNQQRRGVGLKDKMPDIQKTLDMVQFLKTRKVGISIDVGASELTGCTTAWIGPNRGYFRAQRHSLRQGLRTTD